MRGHELGKSAGIKLPFEGRGIKGKKKISKSVCTCTRVCVCVGVGDRRIKDIMDYGISREGVS